MSARPKKSPTTEAEAPPRSSETAEFSARNAARDEQIRRRAYEIHLERGGQLGRELDDWLQAENEFELQRWAQEGGRESAG